MAFPPRVLDEWQTLRTVVNTRCSLARIGDGEIKLMLEHSCKGQQADPGLGKQLRRIAERGSDDAVLVGIPRVYGSALRNHHKAAFWDRYATEERSAFYRGRLYHSSFVTRPDHFPVLDCPEFWALWRSIWQDRPVLYVKGCTTPEPRVPEMLDNACLVDPMPAPPRDAWAAHDALLADCRTWAAAHGDGVVVLCLGPTATVLAAELGRLGHQACDLGHAPSYYRDRGKLREGVKAA